MQNEENNVDLRDKIIVKIRKRWCQAFWKINRLIEMQISITLTIKAHLEITYVDKVLGKVLHAVILLLEVV